MSQTSCVHVIAHINYTTLGICSIHTIFFLAKTDHKFIIVLSALLCRLTFILNRYMSIMKLELITLIDLVMLFLKSKSSVF